MTLETYFNKNKIIYGISSKFAFGEWTCHIKKFNNLDTAQKWLNTPENDFRERELCSLSKIKHYLTFMHNTKENI